MSDSSPKLPTFGNKIAHINQPRFLPAPNLFQRMLIANVFVWRDDVQFSRHDWENRNRIRAALTREWITAPVQKCPSGTRITDVLLDDSQDWRAKMCRKIEAQYRKAPYFKECFPAIQEILMKERSDKTLVTLSYELMDAFLEAWGIECHFVKASQLGCTGSRDDILIAMCRKLGADIYMSGEEGIKYNRPERWREAGIKLVYHHYDWPVYPQGYPVFLSRLSALDLLLNCGRDEGRAVLDQRVEELKIAYRIYD